jgi:hypothetical protein
MNMIRRPADGKSLHIVSPRDASDESPEAWPHLGVNNFQTLFGAPNAVREIARVRVRHTFTPDRFSRPYGTHSFSSHLFPAINRWAIFNRP